MTENEPNTQEGGGRNEQPNESVTEEPTLEELSQVRIAVHEDRQKFNELLEEFQQKYGNLIPELEKYNDADLDMNDEKAEYLTNTIRQVQQIYQMSGGGR